MESKINLSQVKPINYRVTASLVNQFIVSTTQFLNRFGTRCDLKLRQVEHNMHRISTTLNILEAKLASIPAADSKPAQNAAAAPAPAAPQPQAADVQGQPQAQQQASPAPATAAAQPTPEAPAPAPTPAPAPAPEPEPVVQGPKLKDDPRFSTYFKMLKMGVPPPAVKVKMQTEGVDPDMLDQDPEGPAPPGAPAPIASDDSEADDEDEFSD